MPNGADDLPLVYVQDTMPGWQRRRRGRGFVYTDAQGQPVRDPQALARIRALAIPPAYEDVWICPLPNGHLQATGRDARGRKQYRYHPLWHAQQGQSKFDRLRAFGRKLPALRRRVTRDLARPGLPQEKVLAAIVRLLDTTYVRIGNAEYARQNGSFGLTTLRCRHAAVHGRVLKLQFPGKSGVRHRIRVDDPVLARIVKRCQELPGQELFQYLDENGQPQDVDSNDVNTYLREAMGEDFSAKDFRTWHASALALEKLLGLPAPSTKRETQRSIRAVIGDVAAQLGHTVTVCRQSYVHAGVLENYVAGRLLDACAGSTPVRGLRQRECRLMALLEWASREAPIELSPAATAPSSRPPSRPAASAAPARSRLSGMANRRSPMLASGVRS